MDVRMSEDEQQSLLAVTWTMRPERWWSVDDAETGRADPRTT